MVVELGDQIKLLEASAVPVAVVVAVAESASIFVTTEAPVAFAPIEPRSSKYLVCPAGITTGFEAAWKPNVTRLDVDEQVLLARVNETAPLLHVDVARFSST